VVVAAVQVTRNQDELTPDEKVSSAIELDRDFVPAEVTRYEERVPDPAAAIRQMAPANNANNSNVTNVSTTVNVGGPNIIITTQKRSVPFVLRAVWFLAIGWWLSAAFILVGYLCCLTAVLAPVGFWFLNRIPQAQTLRMRNSDLHVTQKDGVTFLTEGRTEQIPWYYRALYFPVGLVIGAVWLCLAWAVSLLIVTLPLSIWMIDRSPAVISLQRN
jgi:uncharacterized membrane protein YccF (DUF307 family)